jgi:hypothetical protein
MLNLFKWALTPQCPEIILETVVINFLSVLHSSSHGLRETLGKMECENLPVSSKLFCHSSNILCFAIGSKSRATDCALYTILPKVAGAHMKLTSRSLRVSCQHFCLHSHTSGWVSSGIFCDSIALIELILSVKIKYLTSASSRKLRRENTRWPPHPKSYIGVYRVMNGKTSHSIYQRTIIISVK